MAGFGLYASSEFFGPWDALKVRVGTGKSSGSGAKLIESRMNLSSLRIYVILQFFSEVLNCMAYGNRVSLLVSGTCIPLL